MSSKMPPVPPANRSPKGSGEGDHARGPDRGEVPEAPKKTNKTGRLGNIKQNTTNQGLQQDR
mgnify:CR=1 FL=1